MVRKILWLLAIFLVIHVHPAEAQQPGKIPRIGFVQRRLPPTPTTPDPLADAFRQGLRDLGYTDGKNIEIEQRYGGGTEDRLPVIIAELVQLNVDALVVPSSRAIGAAKQATKTIPIVMVTTVDPIAAGFIETVARLGGNITGSPDSLEA